jgi:hypothetical protein
MEQKLEFSYKGENIEFTVGSNVKSPFGHTETVKVSQLGEEILKHYSEKAVTRDYTSNTDKMKTEKFFKEVLGLSVPQTREDLTFPNNPALYTTIVNNMVERAFRPSLIANGLIKTVSLNPKGVSGIKFPISTLRTALDLDDDGELDDPTNDNYASETVTLKWIYAYEVITWQLIQQGIVDPVQDQFFELGDALSRKVDKDILTSFETASPSNNTKNNYKEVASFGYDALMEGILRAEANNAMPDAVVTAPLTLLQFMKDSKVITALGYNSVDKGSLFPRMRDFFGLSMLTTTQATANNVYILDTARVKYFVEGSPIQVLDGRKSTTVNWELIALKLYGVKVIQPEAVYRIVSTYEESS